jgi:hypothetical protein
MIVEARDSIKANILNKLNKVNKYSFLEVIFVYKA